MRAKATSFRLWSWRCSCIVNSWPRISSFVIVGICIHVENNWTKVWKLELFQHLVSLILSRCIDYHREKNGIGHNIGCLKSSTTVLKMILLKNGLTFFNKIWSVYRRDVQIYWRNFQWLYAVTSWAIANYVICCEISFLPHQSIFSARYNSIAAAVGCNGESQQYSVKSSSSSASKRWIFTYSNSEQITSCKVLGNQMDKL